MVRRRSDTLTNDSSGKSQDSPLTNAAEVQRSPDVEPERKLPRSETPGYDVTIAKSKPTMPDAPSGWGFPPEADAQDHKPAGAAAPDILYPTVDGEISVQVGPNTLSPVKYNSFVVGPVRVTVRLHPGESAEMGYFRASKIVNWMYQQEFSAAHARFLEDLRRSVEGTATAAGPRG